MSKARKYYNLIHIEPEGYLPKKGSHRFVLKFQSKVYRNGKSAAVIQMNGSMAGPGEKKIKWKCDSTIGKVLSWCYENQENPIDIVHCLNLFSYVDPHPNNLSGMSEKALNKVKNDNWIKTICKDVDYIILAHGDCKGIDEVIVEKRIKQVLKWFEKYDLHRVGDLTEKGNPKHGRAWNHNPLLTLHRKKIK